MLYVSATESPFDVHQRTSRGRAVDRNRRRGRAEFIKPRLTEENLARLRKLADLAAGLDVPLATLALAWCLRRPELTSCIIGATNERQILQNVKASDLRLDDDVLETISAILGE